MPKVFLLVTVLFSAFFSPGMVRAQQEDPEITVEVERNQVYEGESFIYQITIKNVQNPSQPKLGDLKECLNEYLGESSQNKSGITIVQGRMTQYNTYGTAFRYRLTPLKKGYLTIPGPEAEVDGEMLRGRSVTVKVIGPEEQDIAFLESSSDRDTVYPLLPFFVTLKVYIKALPGRIKDQSPLTVQRSAPALSIPWVTELPPGLVPARHWREWTGTMEKRGGIFFEQSEGFTINRIASFFPTDPSVYLPPHRRMSRLDAQGKEQDYWEYTLKREFMAKKTGEFRFGPATLKGTFGTKWDRSQGLTGETIYAVGEAILVTVKDAPLEGRPAEYIGAIGAFELSGTIAPTRARVGDPITLTLRLKGKGTLDMARAPDLQALPEIEDRFKIYEATEETKGSVRTFTYSLRPMEEGITCFPPVPLAYYDVDRERYVTLKTDPITLEIQKADKLTDEDIVTGSRKGDENNNRSIEARKEGLFANITDPSALRNEKSITDLGMLGLELSGMLALYIVAFMVRNLHRKRTGDPALQRRRSAVNRARSRLRDGLVAIENGDLRVGTDQVRTAIAGLVADVADLPEGGVTPRDVKDRLESFQTDGSVINKTVRLLEACDATQYGAQGSDVADLTSGWEEVFEALVRELKKGGKLR